MGNGMNEKRRMCEAEEVTQHPLIVCNEANQRSSAAGSLLTPNRVV